MIYHANHANHAEQGLTAILNTFLKKNLSKKNNYQRKFRINRLIIFIPQRKRLEFMEESCQELEAADF